MRTVTAARKIILSHLSTLPLSFDPKSYIEWMPNKIMLNWAARIKEETIPFPRLDTDSLDSSGIATMIEVRA